jgi:hypothetical protein
VIGNTVLEPSISIVPDREESVARRLVSGSFIPSATIPAIRAVPSANATYRVGKLYRLQDGGS